MAIDLGEIRRLTYTLTSPSGGLVNADSVTLTITLPDGTTTVVNNIAPQSTGQYQYDYLTAQAGRHLARWVATGTNFGAYTEAFDVLDVAPTYLVSLADAKAQLDITSTAHDDEIQGYIAAATFVIETHLDLVTVQRTITEEHYLTDYMSGFGQTIGNPMVIWGLQGAKLALRKRPALSLVSVTRLDDGLTWDVTSGKGLNLNPDGIIDVLFGIPFAGHLEIVYQAGMSIIPQNYILAAEIIIQHLWQTQRGQKGSPKVGALMEPHGYGSSYVGYAIPSRALELLGTGGKLGFA